MNKSINLMSLLILLFSLTAAINADDSRADSKMTDKVKKIIEKSNKALKIDKFRTVKAIEQNLKLSVPAMGLNGSIIIKAIKNKSLITSKMASMTEQQGYNGKTAWSNNMVTGFRTLTGAEKIMITSQTLQNLMWIEKFYDEIKLAGEEKFNGKKCLKLELIKKGLDNAYQFVNIDNYLVEGRIDILVTPQGKIKVTNAISVYSKHKRGFKYPSKFSQAMGPVTMELTVDSFKVDPEFKSNLFDPPAQ